MYIEKTSFSNTDRISFENSVQQKSKISSACIKILGSLNEVFRTSEEELARFQEYQAEKEMWLKRLEETAPRHLKARIRTGGWV